MNIKSSVKLFIIWLTVFFVVGIIIGVASVIYSLNTGLSVMELPQDAKVIIGTITLVGFCPTLGLVCRKAKQEKVKPIYVISVFLQILISICVLSEIGPIIAGMWRNR